MGYAEEDFPVNDAWNKILNQPRALTDRSTLTLHYVRMTFLSSLDLASLGHRPAQAQGSHCRSAAQEALGGDRALLCRPR